MTPLEARSKVVAAAFGRRGGELRWAPLALLESAEQWRSSTTLQAQTVVESNGLQEAAMVVHNNKWA